MILKIKKEPNRWVYFESEIVTTTKVYKDPAHTGLREDDIPRSGKHHCVAWFGNPLESTQGVVAYLRGTDVALVILTEAYLMNDSGKTIERIV